MRELSGIPFKITSQTTGEWHIVVSDTNGVIDTSSKHVLHTNKTNNNDSLYDPVLVAIPAIMTFLIPLRFRGDSSSFTASRIIEAPT